MPRAKRGFKARRRRNRVLKHAKGFYGARGRISATPSSRSTTRGPTRTPTASCKKRDFRRLWITRISAAAKMNGVELQQAGRALKRAGIAARPQDPG